jgi:hypothetical protein
MPLAVALNVSAVETDFLLALISCDKTGFTRDGGHPMKCFTILLVVSPIALVAFVGSAAADGAPAQYPSIGAFSQNGQDVEFRVGLHGLSDEEDMCQIERRVDEQDWAPADLVEGCCPDTIEMDDPYCWEWEDEGDCYTYPDWCSDCDGDDYAECYGECFAKWFYYLVDQCVPPGYVTYRVVGENVDGSIEVEDTGDDCLDPDAGPGDEHDGGGSGMADDDLRRDGDCACSTSPGVSDATFGGVLVLSMLGVGLAALAFSRRRP